MISLSSSRESSSPRPRLTSSRAIESSIRSSGSMVSSVRSASYWTNQPGRGQRPQRMNRERGCVLICSLKASSPALSMLCRLSTSSTPPPGEETALPSETTGEAVPGGMSALRSSGRTPASLRAKSGAPASRLLYSMPPRLSSSIALEVLPHPAGALNRMTRQPPIASEKSSERLWVMAMGLSAIIGLLACEASGPTGASTPSIAASFRHNTLTLASRSSYTSE